MLLIAPPKAQGEITSHFVLNKSSGETSEILISLFSLLISSLFMLEAVILALDLERSLAN